VPGPAKMTRVQGEGMVIRVRLLKNSSERPSRLFEKQSEVTWGGGLGNGRDERRNPGLKSETWATHSFCFRATFPFWSSCVRASFLL
jgi:hypothetical protein